MKDIMKNLIINKYLVLLCFFNVSFFYASQNPQKILGFYRPISIFSDSLDLTKASVEIELTYKIPNAGFAIAQFQIPMTTIASINKNNLTCKELIELQIKDEKYIILAKCTSINIKKKITGIFDTSEDDFQHYFSKLIEKHLFSFDDVQ